MEINWFTFAAQIFNFLVLVALLKRFLYGPITKAMDKREEGFAARQEEAAIAKHDAQSEAEEFRRKSEALDHAREELLAQAGREIEAWRKEHLLKAHAEVERSRNDWYRTIDREKNAFLQDLRRRAGKEVHRMARHVLEKLCDASLERQVIASFLSQLENIDEQKRREIVASIQNSHHRILVESAFDIPDEEQDHIRSLIHELLTDGVDVDFRTMPELVCGIELKAAGYKVAWSAGETLETLEEEFGKALDGMIPS